MAQTVTLLSLDRLIQELRRQLEGGSTYPVPADHELARGRGDCVLEILAIRENGGCGDLPASVTWSVHPRDGRFYDAGAANGNTPTERIGERFPFLWVEPEPVR